MNQHPFYRFDIKSFGGRFFIRIGCIWDGGQKSEYIPFGRTAFAMRYPYAGIGFETQNAAQSFLNVFRETELTIAGNQL